MDWILHNIWVLVAIAAVIARLRGLAKRNQGDAAGGQSAPPKEYEFEDPELAERTRKIREEIQRKIAERRGSPVPPPVRQPAPAKPVVSARPTETPPPLPPANPLLEALRSQLEPVMPKARNLAPVNIPEEAERQAVLMQQLKEAELMQATAQRRIVFETSTADKEPAALQQARAAVLEDLRDPQALRRAFVLREVIGPPVGMRQG